MEPVFENLHASEPQPLGFDPTVKSRAFLLLRADGNLLVYSTTGLANEADAIANLGGAARQYLGHRHEAPSGSGIAPLYAHAADAEGAGAAESFVERHRVGDDFEVIPIPGHTPGATAYLWNAGAHKVLFPGDSIMLRGGRWQAAVLDNSDRASYLSSLELLSELEFDVLAPWATHDGEPPYAVIEGGEAQRQLGEMIERVRAGENG